MRRRRVCPYGQYPSLLAQNLRFPLAIRPPIRMEHIVKPHRRLLLDMVTRE